MSVFDNMRDKLLSYFNTNNEISSDWIKINDGSNPWTIEDFPYRIEGAQFLSEEEKQKMLGVPEDGVDDHCWKCITVNQCWFKNEDNKKPEEFDYSKYSLIEIPKEIRGLYHPNCHCKKFELKTPNAENIELVIPPDKIDNYLFTKKLGWVNYMGYYENNYQEFLDILYAATKQGYASGNYYCVEHTRRGYKINIDISIPGKNDKLGQIFKVKTNYMIFPNGKLKMNTPLGGWVK